MKLIISIILLLSSFTTVNAESILRKIQSHGYLTHIEGAFTAGTTGLGFDVGFPLQEWGRLRIGGVWRPRGHYSDEYAVHINDENQWGQFGALMSIFVGVQPEKYVEMEGKSSMNNFKLLVDFFPIKKHRNFHVTIGFFLGNSTIVEAMNTSIGSNTVAAIKSYNTLRQKAINHEDIDLSIFGLYPSKSDIEILYQKLIDMGEVTIPLGERTDANGNKTVVMECPDRLTVIKPDHEEVYNSTPLHRGWPNYLECIGIQGCDRHFIDCVRTRQKPLTSAEDAFKTHELMNRILVAAGLPDLTQEWGK